MTLPHGWTSRRFDQLGELYSGSTPSSSQTEFWDGATVWVTPTDLSRLNTPYLHDSAKHITERGLRNCSARLLPPGSIVLSSRAPIGYVAIPTVPFCTNQGCKSIALHNSYHPEFVYYAVTAAVPRLRRLGEGTTFGEISKSSLAKADVVLPIDKAEQSKIADVLSTIDRAIEQSDALIAKQQRIKTGLMQDLLTCGIDEDGNLRSEQTHEFKDSLLGRIPLEWAVSSIGAEFDIQLGKMLSQASRQSRSPLPYLGNKNVQWDNVDLTNLERMDFDEGERQKFRLKSGDILVCEGGEVGRTCVWREELEECFFQKAIHRLRPKRGYCPSLFPTYMRWAVRNGLLSDFTSRSSIAHLTKEKLAGVPLGVPSKSEQMRISGAMEATDRGLGIHRQQLAKLRALKRGLMQDLLTGNRRVTALLEQERGATA